MRPGWERSPFGGRIPFADRLAALDPDDRGFAATLIRLRCGREIRQGALAERAGVDPSHVSRLESGNKLPSRDVVERIAAALGLDDREHAELVTAAGFAVDRDPRIVAVERLLRDPLLNPKTRTLIERILDDAVAIGEAP